MEIGDTICVDMSYNYKICEWEMYLFTGYVVGPQRKNIITKSVRIMDANHKVVHNVAVYRCFLSRIVLLEFRKLN